jgi:SAM-dependent methyltransferase
MTEATPVGYYQSLNFNNPMTEDTADGLVCELAATHPNRVLDVGCGWAELLLRLLAACPETTGHGVDHDNVLIDRATRNADDRNLSSRVTFSASLGTEEPVDLVLNVGAEHVFGGLDQALVELYKLVRPGGRLLLGTQFWEQPPALDLVEAIGELPTLVGLVDAATSVGWRPLGLKVASPDDWDHFEFRFLMDWEQHVMAPTTRATANRAIEAADEHRRSYLRRRGILGFAFLTLGRPDEPHQDD